MRIQSFFGAILCASWSGDERYLVVRLHVSRALCSAWPASAISEDLLGLLDNNSPLCKHPLRATEGKPRAVNMAHSGILFDMGLCGLEWNVAIPDSEVGPHTHFF